jgi:peptidyl-prolyl cis-trans isomerase A (cyclophilin A)
VRIDRRTLLLAVGSLGATSLAGCTSSEDNDTDAGNDPSGENGDTADDTTADGTATDDGSNGDDGGSSDDGSGDDGGSNADDGGSGDGDSSGDDGNAGNGDDSSGDDTDDGTVTATLQTNFGDIEIELFAERAPRTVENFVGLATGEKTWTDPETGEQVDGEPLYEDVIFHRVIEGFVIQGGDPTGTGRGGPGYEFDDEFHPELRHDEAGILSMANSGPDTNGSQFFITLAPQPHLDDKHSVFGQVTDGMDVVEEIGSVETDANDRPVEPVVLESVTVHDG